MREIKFRSWDGENMFLVDSYIGFENGEAKYLEDVPIYADTVYNADTNEVKKLGYRVSNIELMQFTGLLDKNGTPIFEGDVITNFGVENNLRIRKYEVKFNEEGARFFLENTKAKDSTSMDKWSMKNCEVIGNIYQDSFLLENI